eukprot:gene43149-58427_t
MKRRHLLAGGLILPLLPFAFAGRSHASGANPYLADNFGPVEVESTLADLHNQLLFNVATTGVLGGVLLLAGRRDPHCEQQHAPETSGARDVEQELA